MNSMKAEIIECLRANLESGLDPYLVSFGFTRRMNALFYSRELADAIQTIEIAVEIHPKDRPDSAAAVYPWLSVNIGTVETLALDMVGGDVSLLSGLEGNTLRQPVEFTSAKAAPARWFIFQPDSVPAVVREIKSFLEKWTVPFLNSYLTSAGICEEYDRNSARVINDLGQKLRVAAAMMLCGRTADAMRVMDRWFGKPGSRKRYQRVFDYIITKS